MKLRRCIRDATLFLANPEKGFKGLGKRSLEETLEQYMKLLLLSGLVAAAVSILWTVGRASYYHLVRHVTVEYLNLLNYASSIAAGIFFFYLFAGTFLLGLIALLLNPFTRIKFTKVVMLLCHATFPVLLFGWISTKVALVLLVWSLFLLVLGLRTARKA